MAKSKVEHVVVDAVAFFRQVHLQDVAENVHTLRAVVNEIRDKATRQLLAVLPYEIKFREPSTECIQIVSDFARKTGDYQSLSAVDIRVIALAYQLTKEYVGVDGLKKQPETKITYSASSKPLQKAKDIAGFYYPASKDASKDSNAEHDKPSPGTTEDNMRTGDIQLELNDQVCKDEEEDKEKMETTVEGGCGMEDERTCDEVMKEEEGEASVDAGKDSEEDERRIEEENKMEERTDQCDEAESKPEQSQSEDAGIDDTSCDMNDGDEGIVEGEEEEEDDDEEDNIGWITPQNISQVREQMAGSGETNLEGIKVGCMTTDFAMQNVLIQLGIPVISVNGMLIKHAKSFVLRCHDCFKVTHDMGKVFCPKCGNKSLDKVTMTIDEDGSRRYHMSRRRPVNTRGLRYNLPKPQGGKHTSNPILYADQRIPQNREARKGNKKTNVFDPDFDAMGSPFATHDVTSRSALLGVRQLGGQGSGSRRNPNENRRQSKKGKRR
ncbi:RNA-binding protein NOB1 [Strongylocentrotus purpuratus]|uniref:RNA-binding protein NOB1 n=1 Tax=Strongylocentrotus purpuratus TaxID=7668 RepID=A0A7M7N4F5_STRPU|nr:RNA-binding protein NOB1 [Strongylocentrotus purpuratus]